ncbi:MAG TPA: type II toxin-antitoxin system Phd/YefM family antitoxin [Myxococcota bacterium]|nr:type II toxin-antitoxin system Phd/YefM family antitoxin [Myxococcota bacterium]HON25943.1 type II toxin-antitoxin system Phd/YefM family antitoxin [Myxococcota bacterium]HOS62713.1 type II toxin-antitoxin system Phd/YefM family antitoxin [Myxococcota bacterium]HPC92832.1 type II toxin-antitoxin system Phd/YefM family antitoxin [Myxococcota bacterium]HPL25871.1 type II toxin-antitoxin system Phd/YefM family antitoxin [Myxococcota bacterium]
MPKVSNIIPVSDFRQDAAGILDRVMRDKEPVVITRRGRAAAILISVDEHERSEHERQLLYILARGEAEIRAGKGYELDDVLAEADKLLAGG